MRSTAKSQRRHADASASGAKTARSSRASRSAARVARASSSAPGATRTSSTSSWASASSARAPALARASGTAALGSAASGSLPSAIARRRSRNSANSRVALSLDAWIRRRSGNTSFASAPSEPDRAADSSLRSSAIACSGFGDSIARAARSNAGRSDRSSARAASSVRPEWSSVVPDIAIMVRSSWSESAFRRVAASMSNSPRTAGPKRKGSSPFRGPRESRSDCACFASTAPESRTTAPVPASNVPIRPATSELMVTSSCATWPAMEPSVASATSAAGWLPSDDSATACARTRNASARIDPAWGSSSANPWSRSRPQSQRPMRDAASRSARASAVFARMGARRSRSAAVGTGGSTLIASRSSGVRTPAGLPRPSEGGSSIAIASR